QGYARSRRGKGFRGKQRGLPAAARSGERERGREMSKRAGPPKHQNTYAWKPNLGRKINETVSRPPASLPRLLFSVLVGPNRRNHRRCSRRSPGAGSGLCRRSPASASAAGTKSTGSANTASTSQLLSLQNARSAVKETSGRHTTTSALVAPRSLGFVPSAAPLLSSLLEGMLRKQTVSAKN
uniref:Uncharacterized protein n=1 Tax=Aegilops tauschii subsp. strangulata TaxID=200361 RepID=A0A453FKJ3_AEGTS